MTTIDDHGWAAPHVTREVANLQQTVLLLEQRNAELEAESRKRLDVVKRQGKVIDTARAAVRWWPTVVDRYPTLIAPWVGRMSQALAEMDGDAVLAKALAELLG